MSKIISIGTAVPAFKHDQQRILEFMQQVYALDAVEARKLKFLYRQSGIDTRYSAIADFSKETKEWNFYPQLGSKDAFPSIEQRMKLYQETAAPIAVEAIQDCLKQIIKPAAITHLITVSCTGMSAPGLDLELVELLDLPKNLYRTSVNFMGCYAAIHALKMADSICKWESNARVMIICTELCTLHFQQEATADNIASSLLFGDGAAAVLVTPDNFNHVGLYLKSFYSEIIPKGKNDMSWILSSSGFLMTLSGYVPDLIQEDFEFLMNNAMEKADIVKSDIAYWCIHPGGKRILDAIQKSLTLKSDSLSQSYEVLKEYGNMSSPTILFVLKKIMQSLKEGNATAEQTEAKEIFGAAFGPGLTMETFIASPYA